MKGKSEKIWIIALLFILMFLIAILDHTRGIFLFEFKQYFGVKDTQLGILLGLAFFSYLKFMYVGGWLCELLGQRKVMYMALSICLLSLIGLSRAPSFAYIMLFTYTLNIGVAFITIITNTVIPLLVTGTQAILMNLTHFFYGFGAATTQRISGILLHGGVSWRTIYFSLVMAFLLLLVVFSLSGIQFPTRKSPVQAIPYRQIFRQKLVYFYMLALGAYTAAEISIANWFFNFITVVYHLNAERVTVYTSLFFATFALGRLLGGFVVEKLNYLRSVQISLGLAASLSLIGLIMGARGLGLFSLSGLFFAIVFPTLVVSISTHFKEQVAYVTGTIITAATAMSMMINMTIGYLNDLVGVYLSFYLVVIMLGISLGGTFLIKNSLD